MRERHDDRWCARRLDVDPLAVLAAVDDVRRQPDDAAVDRRVDRGAGSRADVEAARVRTLTAADLVPGRPVAAAAEELVAEPREEPLVRLPAHGLERERAVAGAVVADRRDVAGGDRQLQS